MGIRFFCPNGHKLNVKSELAGKIGICPKCQARMEIPTTSVWELARKDEREKPTNDERARGDDGATLDKCDERLGGLDDVAAQGETAQSAQAQWDEDDEKAFARRRARRGGVDGRGASRRRRGRPKRTGRGGSRGFRSVARSKISLVRVERPRVERPGGRRRDGEVD